MFDLAGYAGSIASAMKRFGGQAMDLFESGSADVTREGSFDVVRDGTKGGRSGFVVGSGVSPFTASNLLQEQGVDVKPQQFTNWGKGVAGLAGLAGAVGGGGPGGPPAPALRAPQALPPQINFPAPVMVPGVPYQGPGPEAPRPRPRFLASALNPRSIY